MRQPTARWTVGDVERLPDNERERYAIVDGEPIVTTAPHWQHQYTCTQVASSLDNWGKQDRPGIVLDSPGVEYTAHDSVSPGVVWIRRDRLGIVFDDRGKLRLSPDVAVEVLSPGSTNVQRDRVPKLDLYSRFGVEESWRLDRAARSVEVYDRVCGPLPLSQTFRSGDTLTSALLPGFACPVAGLFCA